MGLVPQNAETFRKKLSSPVATKSFSPSKDTPIPLKLRLNKNLFNLYNIFLAKKALYNRMDNRNTSCFMFVGVPTHSQKQQARYLSEPHHLPHVIDADFSSNNPARPMALGGQTGVQAHFASCLVRIVNTA